MCPWSGRSVNLSPLFLLSSVGPCPQTRDLKDDPRWSSNKTLESARGRRGTRSPTKQFTPTTTPTRDTEGRDRRTLKDRGSVPSVILLVPDTRTVTPRQVVSGGDSRSGVFDVYQSFLVDHVFSCLIPGVDPGSSSDLPSLLDSSLTPTWDPPPVGREVSPLRSLGTADFRSSQILWMSWVGSRAPGGWVGRGWGLHRRLLNNQRVSVQV